jgi:formiminotetrahydrofolate cyclodeaminase
MQISFDLDLINYQINTEWLDKSNTSNINISSQIQAAATLCSRLLSQRVEQFKIEIEWISDWGISNSCHCKNYSTKSDGAAQKDIYLGIEVIECN